MMVAVDAQPAARTRLAPWLRYGVAGCSLAVGVVALVTVDGVLLPRYLAAGHRPSPVSIESLPAPVPQPQPALEILPASASAEPAPAQPVPLEAAAATALPAVAPLLFARSSAWLSPASRSALAKVAALLAEQPSRRILLSGHTDSSGPEVLNEALSVARARRSQAWLVERGIAAERIDVQGFGSSRPLDERESPLARARNRRVEIDFR